MLPRSAIPLFAALALPVLLHAPSARTRPACAPPPDLYRMKLRPTGQVAGAEGTALLKPARTPLGMPVGPDGHWRFEARVAVDGLPAPATLGPYTTYVAWVAKADLSRVSRIGPLDADGRGKGTVEENKFLVYVTAEPSADVEAPSGPVVVQGMSPSALMQNMLTEPLNNGGMPPC